MPSDRNSPPSPQISISDAITIRWRLDNGRSPGTINRDLAVVRRILNLAARLWRDENDRPWLTIPPLIQMQRHPNRRAPYPLSLAEQKLLFFELDAHLVSLRRPQPDRAIRYRKLPRQAL
jgi:hypothetical protein